MSHRILVNKIKYGMEFVADVYKAPSLLKVHASIAHMERFSMDCNACRRRFLNVEMGISFGMARNVFVWMDILI